MGRRGEWGQQEPLLTSCDRPVGKPREERQRWKGKQHFPRPDPQAQSPLPGEDELALLWGGSTLRDPSLPRVSLPCGTQEWELSTFSPQCWAVGVRRSDTFGK